jgi:hypothetical protein
MGLVDRKNPNATPRSVLIAALNGGVGGGLFAVIAPWWNDFESSLMLVKILSMGVIGAGAGAIFEWQWHDDLQDLWED